MEKPTITPFHHCNLCNHKKLHEYKGTYCGITGEKPAFTGKCSAISFREDLEEIIKATNEAHYRVEDRKTPSLTHLFMYIAYSIGAAYGAYFVTMLLWEYGFVSTVTIGLGIIPLVLLRMAPGPYSTYLNDRKAVVKGVQELDEVLRIYGINYEVTDVKVDKDMHGNKDFYLTLRYAKTVPAK